MIRSPRGAAFDQRILGIHTRLSEVIASHRPDFMAVESPFVEKNAATALKLGQIRGGILLTEVHSGANRKPRSLLGFRG
ncbi:MAG TPA: crossover junction endodeoxyribonuclease RuvC, partial [Holophaga sp.]|nr:crossover junction endodeoxyribonuclease RuvC [Holophaga sp.]